MNKPSDIVRLYRTASRAARRIGQEYKLDEAQLEPMFSQAQIDAIFNEIDYVNTVEGMLEGRFAALDAIPNGERGGA
jgi:hypothetical protein